MAASNINDLFQIWAATLPADQNPPFINKQDLYNTINAIEVGDVPWTSFSLSFNGKAGDRVPSWKHASYDVWYQDPCLVMHQQIGNRDFVEEMDFAAKEVQDEQGTRLHTDFMSGDFAWRQLVPLFNKSHIFLS
jgi:hypothetical protein